MDERLEMMDTDEEMMDAELDLEAVDLLNETLKDFDDFLKKMRTMIKQIKVYDFEDGEDDGNRVVKGIMHDLIAIKASLIIMDTGKIERKRADILKNIERIKREERMRQATAFNPQI